MSFAKYVNLLQTSRLYFASLDSLEDPWEGVENSKAFDEEYLRQFYSLLKDSSMIEEYVQRDIRVTCANSNTWRRRIHASCWCQSQSESEALWKIFSDLEYGIAIKSTVGNFKNAVQCAPQNIILGQVQYIDYRKQEHPKSNPLRPAFFKRESFSHEKELRAILWLDENNQIDFDLEKKGSEVNISLNELISEIVISPKAPNWFIETVNKISNNAGIDETYIRKSRLFDKPDYIPS